MEHKRGLFELKEQRNADLMKTYRELVRSDLSRYGRIQSATLMRRVVNANASRYWVSSERAYAVMLKMLKGLDISFMKDNRRKFYESLYQDFIDCKRKHPQLNARHIAEIVVARPAPCFPITARVAKNIIYQEKEKCRKLRSLQYAHLR